MSRSFKKGKFLEGKSNEKLIPKGIVIIAGRGEIFIKKEFVAGFGYENGANRKTPLDPKIFHQTINSDLPRKQKGQGQKKIIFLLGPDPRRMGQTIASAFANFMIKNNLRKGGGYEVRKVVKEKSVKKPQLETC
ncbi:hypothetical protein COX67_01765 [Candidatus Falkowbacteria bacterium CG_4_10_14_0_2_um_filter_36_22]|uniref:Uncharacterized protein n=3 Tax=Candidatus Falkowiibacteriota TaxID=1752728 RepID=A0A2G9ZMR2_9BACT|nr:MAG: hypothetical protein AUJ35_01180 [Candidatus Falkowbacteria bacterium CG1_02_41_21]PIP34442.1 MAG: hypothetical protein COX21_02895 [Candidatus Falkowbacteria bacterium CG23_combo_of_CG06-09_8_20_14_all_41_10]PIZ11372.1 MAG: hypothetical protein COY54_00505 [Candidatus Falkowbacteria bacterium CG_4_10_14_0_8_um_filter_41_36]PJA11059.1 MAG: hypothetical protein COX67_01765 [Candidatus Falkowbacteria bacterium CG_4_10_14_0_2_um_filter_36_22]